MAQKAQVISKEYRWPREIIWSKNASWPNDLGRCIIHSLSQLHCRSLLLLLLLSFLAGNLNLVNHTMDLHKKNHTSAQCLVVKLSFSRPLLSLSRDYWMSFLSLVIMIGWNSKKKRCSAHFGKIWCFWFWVQWAKFIDLYVCAAENEIPRSPFDDRASKGWRTKIDYLSIQVPLTSNFVSQFEDIQTNKHALQNAGGYVIFR